MIGEEELAAVIAAMQALGEPAPENAAARMPAWRRAMRLESTGNDDVR